MCLIINLLQVLINDIALIIKYILFLVFFCKTLYLLRVTQCKNKFYKLYYYTKITKNAQKPQRHFISNKYVKYLQIKFLLAKVELLI